MRSFQDSIKKINDSINVRMRSIANPCDGDYIFFQSAAEIEYLYLTSWSASKIIDIPVDDMLIYPRNITTDNNNEAHQDLYADFSKKLKIQTKINTLLKGLRLYGTAFLVMICDDDLMENPLSKNAKLKNLINFSRFDCTSLDYDQNISSPNFMQPIYYNFVINRSSPIKVHYSRVIRSDNIIPLSVNKWRSPLVFDGSLGFGVSELSRCYESIKNEQIVSRAIQYLTKEASIPIIKAQGMQDALAGQVDAFDNKDMSLDKFVSNINDLKSVYKTVLMGENMDITRLNASFTGLPEIFDRFNQQLAAVADIPMTRFFAQSAKGINNSGEADLQNYYTKIAALQSNKLTPIYDQLDIIIKNTLNIDYDYFYEPLWNESTADKATADFQNAQRDQIYIANGVLSAQDIRSGLYHNDTYPSIEKEIDPSATIDIDNLNRADNG